MIKGGVFTFVTKESSILIVAGTVSDRKIRKLLDGGSDFYAISERAKGEILVEQVERLNPGIVVIDIEAPGFDWPPAVKKLKQTARKPGVVLLVGTPKEADLLSAFREGVDAYLPRRSLQTELVPALQAVKQGRIYLSNAHTEVIRRHMLRLELGKACGVSEVQDGIAKLSIREKEIFPLLADGISVKEAARILGISPKTVETHKSNIMKKLNLHKITDLTKLAIMKDLISL